MHASLSLSIGERTARRVDNHEFGATVNRRKLLKKLTTSNGSIFAYVRSPAAFFLVPCTVLLTTSVPSGTRTDTRFLLRVSQPPQSAAAPEWLLIIVVDGGSRLDH